MQPYDLFTNDSKSIYYIVLSFVEVIVSAFFTSQCEVCIDLRE